MRDMTHVVVFSCVGVVKFSISDPETESSSSIFPMLVASGSGCLAMMEVLT